MRSLISQHQQLPKQQFQFAVRSGNQFETKNKKQNKTKKKKQNKKKKQKKKQKKNKKKQKKNNWIFNTPNLANEGYEEFSCAIFFLFIEQAA